MRNHTILQASQYTLCYYACTSYTAHSRYAKILKVDLWNTCTLFSEKKFQKVKFNIIYPIYHILEVHIFCGLATGKFHWQIDLVMPFIFFWNILHHAKISKMYYTIRILFNFYISKNTIIVLHYRYGLLTFLNNV